MYNKPSVERFGSFRDLTLAGCTGGSDGLVENGSIATGDTPIVGPGGVLTTCFAAPPVGSR